MVPPPSSRTINRGFFLVLAVLLAAEFLLFDLVGAKHHTWVYPRWNDQIQYLTEGYTGYEYSRDHGFAAGLKESLLNRSAQGTLHDFLAVLVFSVAGPSRSAALSINILALVAWQLALALAVRRRTGCPSLGLLAVALPLSLAWPWSWNAGSAVDFRLDHLAMCAMGVCHAAALMTGGFRSLPRSAVFGAAVGLTLTIRFLTGAYFAPLFAGLIVAILLRPGRLNRLLAVVTAALVAAAIAGPIFWINRETIWDYYAIGHFTGPESAIRNPNLGILASLRFVFGHLAGNHLGNAFWLGTALALGTLGIGAYLKRSRAGRPRLGGDAVISLLFLGVPAGVLVLHAQKSEIVLGILAPGAIGVALAAAAALRRAAGSRFAAAAAGIALAVSFPCFAARQISDPHSTEFAESARLVNILADRIYRASQAAGLEAPRIGVDVVTDNLDAQIMRVICYERQGRWVPFIMTLPTGIAEAEESVLMSQLAESDFVFLTEEGTEGFWPYDRQMIRMRPQTRAWCEDNMVLAGRFTLFGRPMALYQRPGIPLEP
jgi:hypothetical protein